LTVIKNERQCEITRTQAREFREALSHLRQRLADGDENTRALRRIQEAGMESMLGTLEAELAEYDALRTGTIRSLRLESLAEVPEVLIKARIAAGLTEQQLAERLGVPPDQIEFDEKTGYAEANFARIAAVASALGLKLGSEIALPRPADRAA
jgi:hypothetical protein